MNMTVKKGDNVVVIAGKDKGKTGKVLEVFPEENRVLVDGVNIVTKHKKARNQNEKSGIVKKSAPINASNVMIICPSCGKATRVYHKEIDGKKVRVCKCGVSLDRAYVKASKKDTKKTKVEPAAVEAKPAKTTKKAENSVKKVEKTVKNTEKTTKTAPKAEKTSGTKSTTQKSKSSKKEA